MAMVKSVYKAIEGIKVNERYEMRVSNMLEIREHAKGYADAISDSFNFGYLQGMKAAKAEIKSGGAA